jgi:hypothetical protein
MLNGTNATYTQGNVGVGLNSPQYPIHVEVSGPRAAHAKSTSSSGAGFGFFGLVQSPDAAGTVGWNSSTGGAAHGVFAQSDSSAGRGLYAFASAQTGDAVGVFGFSNSTDGTGVIGHAGALTGVTTGVLGRTDSQSADATGVYGAAAAPAGVTNGVWGVTVSNGQGAAGVYGASYAGDGVSIGVLGSSDSPQGYAVYSDGNFVSSGTKSFLIDHPLDPGSRMLLHYCNEGPQPTNTYRGVVELDETGAALARLPDYFSAINIEPTYQLTAIGAPMPALHVSEEVGQAGGSDPNAFRVAGGVAGARVSWSVTALRNDQWVRAHGAPTEVPKPSEWIGRSVSPGAVGEPSALRRAQRPLPTSSIAPAASIMLESQLDGDAMPAESVLEFLQD